MKDGKLFCFCNEFFQMLIQVKRDIPKFSTILNLVCFHVVDEMNDLDKNFVYLKVSHKIEQRQFPCSRIDSKITLNNSSRFSKATNLYFLLFYLNSSWLYSNTWSENEIHSRVFFLLKTQHFQVMTTGSCIRLTAASVVFPWALNKEALKIYLYSIENE